jgi:hypothetical protein
MSAVAGGLAPYNDPAGWLADAEPVNVLVEIDAAIERARASAARLEQAHRHSIRTGPAREQQRVSAFKAARIVLDLENTRAAVAALLEAAKEVEASYLFEGADRSDAFAKVSQDELLRLCAALTRCGVQS